jgi:hypothetical protein
MTFDPDDKVSYSTKTFLEQRLRSHGAVASFKEISHTTYDITRKKGATVRVRLVGRYLFSEADYHDIRTEDPSVNCILTASPWNRFVDGLREHAKGDKIGMFRMGEFLGALNLERLWEYAKKSK